MEAEDNFISTVSDFIEGLRQALDELPWVNQGTL